VAVPSVSILHRDRSVRRAFRRWSVFAAIGSSLLAGPATALLRIDFEQAYFAHPGMQVWDFCLVHHQGVYSIFYHAIPVARPYPSQSDHIWRATSEDLVHWSAPTTVLSVSNAPHESLAVWSPDVIYNASANSWWMAYTSVDQSYNQTISVAWSANQQTWGKYLDNPAIVPDPDVFFYDPAGDWSVCRDPFLYRIGSLWHILVSVETPDLPTGRGVLAHATAPEMLSWTPLEVFAVNDGATPDRILESSSYIVRDGIHHLVFVQEGIPGVMHLASTDPDTWTFADADWIGLGVAPEVDTFDDGDHFLLSRVGAFRVHPDSTTIHCVARFDTLLFGGGLAHPTIQPATPLARDFAVIEGPACSANPTFGDNPARRGEPAVGLVGNGYFGSAEFFQGPLGAGSPANRIGDAAEGFLESRPFTIAGDSLSLLVGGTDHPDHCFVALMDAQADTVLRLAHGTGNPTMVRQHWDLQDLRWREVYLRIEDSDTTGHINVDDIIESPYDPTTAAPLAAPSPLVRDLGPAPNPGNPRVTLRFWLGRPVEYRVAVHDLRGRLIWNTGPQAGQAGLNRIDWDGVDLGGRRAPAGVYLYRISPAEAPATRGRLTLVP